MKKQVRFNSIVQIKYMHVYLYAARTARQSQWLVAYSDRVRFKRRIEMCNLIIGWIFHDKHRDKMRIFCKV